MASAAAAPVQPRPALWGRAGGFPRRRAGRIAREGLAPGGWGPRDGGARAVASRASALGTRTCSAGYPPGPDIAEGCCLKSRRAGPPLPLPLPRVLNGALLPREA